MCAGSFLCGWMFLLSLTFCIQDAAVDPYVGSFAIIEGVFNARYGSPNGALGFLVIMFVASNYCGELCYACCVPRDTSKRGPAVHAVPAVQGHEQPAVASGALWHGQAQWLLLPSPWQQVPCRVCCHGLGLQLHTVASRGASCARAVWSLLCCVGSWVGSLWLGGPPRRPWGLGGGGAWCWCPHHRLPRRAAQAVTRRCRLPGLCHHCPLTSPATSPPSQLTAPPSPIPAGTFCVTANSRMLYAFARDIPALRWFKEVNKKTGTPINSIIGGLEHRLCLRCLGLRGVGH